MHVVMQERCDLSLRGFLLRGSSLLQAFHAMPNLDRLVYEFDSCAKDVWCCTRTDVGCVTTVSIGGVQNKFRFPLDHARESAA
jgi:hypothetical protein